MHARAGWCYRIDDYWVSEQDIWAFTFLAEDVTYKQVGNVTVVMQPNHMAIHDGDRLVIGEDRDEALPMAEIVKGKAMIAT